MALIYGREADPEVVLAEEKALRDAMQRFATEFYTELTDRMGQPPVPPQAKKPVVEATRPQSAAAPAPEKPQAAAA